MAFIQQASDNFNRANAPLTSAGWNTVTGTGSLNIVSNAVEVNAAGTQSGAFYNTGTWANDQYSEIRITTLSASSGCGPMVRCSNSAATYYAVLPTTLGVTTASLDKVVAGGFTFIATITFNTALATGDIIRLGVVGNSLTVYQNGVQCGASHTDSAITSGFPGLSAKVTTTVTNGVFDDWAGGIWATQTADPTFSPVNGHFASSSFPLTVTISCATPTAPIFYTTDGSTPTSSSLSISSGGTVVLNSAATIKAFASVPGITDSNVIAAPYAVFFNPWVPQNLITGLPDVNPGNPNVLYDTNPKILSANPDGKVFKLWYMGDSGAMSYAESNDGKAFTASGSNPVIVGSGGDGFPRIYKNGSTYWASITSGITGIDIYTSSDGVIWTRAKAGALVPSQGWESSKLWQLNVVTIANGTWYGYYSGGAQSQYIDSWKMGLATSTDGINWTKSPNNPIINEPTANFTWSQVGSTFYGWSGAIPSATMQTSEIFRFSSTSPSGPWAKLSSPTYSSTLVNEFVGNPSGNVIDPTLLEASTAPTPGVYLYCTKTLSGNRQGIICAIASSITLAQLVTDRK